MSVKKSFPQYVPGQDFSGVVTAVGSGVTRLKVGDAVYGCAQEDRGAFQQYMTVQDKAVAAKPAALSHVEAASVPMVAQSALTALEAGGVTEGSKVVVIGASGGTGIFLLQIAKLLGAAEVVGVASAANAEFVKSFGADVTVDYTSQKLSDALKKEYDVVVDAVGGKEQWEAAQKVLKPRGRFVTLVGDESGKMSVGTLLGVGATILGRKMSGLFGEHFSYVLHMTTTTHAVLDRITPWLQEGKLRTSVEKVYDFDKEGVIAMYARCESGRTKGKLVLQIAKDGDDAGQQSSTAQSSSATGTTSSSSSSSGDAAPLATVETDVTTGSISAPVSADAAPAVVFDEPASDS